MRPSRGDAVILSRRRRRLLVFTLMRRSFLCGFALLFFGALQCAPPPLAGASSIKVGGIYGVTGDAAPSNAVAINGARLAVREINASGGLLGRNVEFMVFDNMSSPIGSKLAVRQADAAGVVALVGPSWSSHALPAAREAQQRRIPMCVDSATHPAITLTGDCVFRVCFTDVFQGQILARFSFFSLGLRRMVSMVDLNSDYSLGLDASFSKHYTDLGGAIVARLPYKTSELHKVKDCDALADKVAVADVDGVFIPGHKESGELVCALRRMGVEATAVGGDGWDRDVFAVFKSCESRDDYRCTHWTEQDASPQSREFVQRYGKSAMLSSGLVLAYDAMHVLADAITRAGGTDREAVRKALAKTRNFPGVSGRISFDGNGDPRKNAVMTRIHNGVPVFVKTITPSEIPN